MSYLYRQKMESFIILAIYIGTSVTFVSLVTAKNWFLTFSYGAIACVLTFAALTLLRTDDHPDEYGSKWDYPPLLFIYFIFLLILAWVSW